MRSRSRSHHPAQRSHRTDRLTRAFKYQDPAVLVRLAPGEKDCSTLTVVWQGAKREIAAGYLRELIEASHALRGKEL